MLKRVRQNEQKDCGAAAFATLANLCGRKMSLAEARDLTRSNSTGATLQGLIEAGSKIGLTAEGLEGSIGELRDGIRSKEINLPFIAFSRIGNRTFSFFGSRGMV